MLKKTAICGIALLLAVSLSLSSLGLSEKDSAARLGKLLQIQNWVDIMTRGYLGSEIPKEKMLLYLQQRREDVKTYFSPQCSFQKTNKKFSDLLGEMKKAVVEDDWSRLYKQIKKLKEVRYDYLDALFIQIFYPQKDKSSN